MTEIWKDIEGYEGYYQVSSLGRVRSLDQIVPHRNNSKRLCKGMVLKLFLDKDGYSRVSLHKDKQVRGFFVHRLVTYAFLGDPAGDRIECNHLNGQRSDNRKENLEWVTHKENIQYSWEELERERLHGELNSNVKLTKEQVLYIRKHRILGHEEYGDAPLSKRFNVAKATINKIIHRVTWKHV